MPDNTYSTPSAVEFIIKLVSLLVVTLTVEGEFITVALVPLSAMLTVLLKVELASRSSLFAASPVLPSFAALVVDTSEIVTVEPDEVVPPPPSVVVVVSVVYVPVRVVSPFEQEDRANIAAEATINSREKK